MKKHSYLRLASLALALVLALTLVPVSLLAKTVQPAWTVPSGYNAHDYNAIASFLEQESAAGVKNGEKLSSTYNPSDPGTWGVSHFTWTSGSSKRIQSIYTIYFDLVGSFDLSDCTSLESCLVYGNRIAALNVSGCTSLNTLYCYDNKLTELNVSTNTNLGYLNCSRNKLTALDVSHNTGLVILGCGNNNIETINVSSHTSLTSLNVSATKITSIDLSHNTRLDNLYCKDNALTELDLSHNSSLPLNSMAVVGDGKIGTELLNVANTFAAYAYPDEGAEFIGWYTPSGTLLSTDAVYTFYSSTSNKQLVAHFTEAPEPPVGLIGDVNFDGSVDVADALLVMRHAMGIITLTDEQLAVADLDGDGAITISDAIIIMRITMGIG